MQIMITVEDFLFLHFPPDVPFAMAFIYLKNHVCARPAS